MRQKFTLLWVEDKPKAVKEQAGEISDYLNTLNYFPDIIFDDGKSIEKIMKEENVDIVVADKNIADESEKVKIKTGIDVVKFIREKEYWVDILLYSAKDFDKSQIQSELVEYSFVEIIEGKIVVDPIKKLIDKNLNRCNDIVYLRGMLLSRIIDLELEINSFFVKYFKIPSNVENHFHDFMLENRFSLESKKVALERIVEEKGIKSEFKEISSGLDEITKSRNLLAHCKVHPSKKNTLISVGKEKEFSKKNIHEILKMISSVSVKLNELIKKC